MSEKHLASGITMLGRFRPCMCATFIIHHNKEAVILELPPGSAKRRPPWVAARRFLRRNKLDLLFMTASHNHWDHLGGFRSFRRTFPKARFVSHWTTFAGFQKDILDYSFSDSVFTTMVGGEPLYLIHAPKHSYEDVLLVFRGAVCTGDWSLGPYPDCNRIVSVEHKIQSLRLVRNFLNSSQYTVHTTFSAHGNDIRHGVDFHGMLNQMERYWAQ